MSQIKAFLREIISPDMTESVREEINKENTRNMFTLSVVTCLAEVVTLALYAAMTGGRFGGNASLASFLSVIACILISACAALTAWRIRARERYQGALVEVLCCAFFLLIIAWAVVVSYRHYVTGQELLTFYAVVLCLACFVTFRPLVGYALTLIAYGAMFFVAWSVDRAESITVFNYVLLALLTGAGITVRFIRQKKMAQNVIELRQKNDRLSFVSRHDTLTGIYNRTALAEDGPSYVGRPITLVLTDIDYFKEVNDTYGHTVGDRVLKETCKALQTWYPGAALYRYGGDECLLVIEGDDVVVDEQKQTEIVTTEGPLTVAMGFGAAAGTPQNTREWAAMIVKADRKLYEVKRRVHRNDDERIGAR